MTAGWRVYAASAVGKSHLDKGIPCQDAFAQAVEGNMLVAAVCDGAGSAAHSDVGAAYAARFLVDGVCSKVRAYGERLARDEDLAAIVLGSGIALLRHIFNDMARQNGTLIIDYACTLVGVIASPAGGLLFHVGDGIGVVSFDAEDSGTVLSLPENGEYANETFFITSERWESHLRLTPFQGPVRRVALMSDGAQSFAMEKKNAGLYMPFIEPVERFLLGVDETDGNDALAATLSDPRTFAITGDDKTLLLAYCG